MTGRRAWSIEEKLRILAQSTAPGSSPALACRKHGISTSQFYTWRKQFLGGTQMEVMPGLSEQERSLLPTESSPGTPGVGLVEVELPSGVKFRVTGAVKACTIRRILAAFT